MIDDALRGAGYDPRSTPLDTLMAAPLGTHLSADDALLDDEDHEDDDFAEGFQTEELPLEPEDFDLNELFR